MATTSSTPQLMPPEPDAPRRWPTALSAAAVPLLLVAALSPGIVPVPATAASRISLAIAGCALVALLLPVGALVVDGAAARAARLPWIGIAVASAGLLAQHLGLLSAAPSAIAGADGLLLHVLFLGALLGLPCRATSTRERAAMLLDIIVVAGSATTLLVAVRQATDGGAPLHVGALAGDAMLLAAAAALWLRGLVRGWGSPLAPLAGAAVLHVALETLHPILPAGAVARGLAGLIVLPAAMVGWAAARQHAFLAARRECPAGAGHSRLPTAAAVLTVVTVGAALLLPDAVPTDAVVVVGAGVWLTTLLREALGARWQIDAHERESREAGDRRLAALVRHGSDLVTILDADTTVRYASPSHLPIVGIPPELLVGRRMDQEIHRQDLAAARRGFARLLSGESPRESLVVRLRDGQGHWRWIEAVGTNLLHEPSIGGLVLNSRDITDRKQLEALLTEQTLRDPLTGLGNRRLFADRLSHALLRRQRSGGDVGVVFLDLDHFKVVNDTLGHSQGDALLVAVAERLTALVRSGDTVARLGGDEFAIILEEVAGRGEADRLTDRIMAALDRPFDLDDRELFVGASIGVAWAAPGQSADELVSDADLAMYDAKANGRGRVRRFQATMRTSVTERLELEADIRRALERDEFTVVYQPVVDLESGRVAGAEALIRWVHPEKGVVLPSRFIPVAEESELIVQIGRFVLRRAAADAARIRGAGPGHERVRIAVNLSGRHLLSPELLRDVLAAMGEARITGSALAVELTESVLVANESVITGRLQALRELGLRVALDDFGTGYSSLAYLRRFPIDILKIDKSFIASTGQTERHDGLTRAIISIGQSLGMRTIAEGVETMEQLEQLRAMGCSLAQGYLLARPVAAEQLITLVQEWTPVVGAAPAAAA